MLRQGGSILNYLIKKFPAMHLKYEIFSTAVPGQQQYGSKNKKTIIRGH